MGTRKPMTMYVEVESQPRSIPKTLLAALGGGLLILVGVVALYGSSPAAETTSPAADTSLYTLAGFKVVTTYKCIFPTCTDFWCNANCNHHPSYCPASFCKKEVTKIPVPTPPPTEPPTSAVVPTAAPTPEPTMTPAPTCAITNAWQDAMAKNGGANYWGPDQCHPIVCLGINKAWKDMTAEDLASPVLADQCTNCFCFGCNSTQFQPNCGGVAPTMAACTNRGCCPNNCLNGLGNIAKAKCTDPACADCAAGLFGMNCA